MMNRKAFLIFAFVLITFSGWAQNDTLSSHRFYGGIQIGGQNMFSIFHETEFFQKSSVKLHTHILAGINNPGKNNIEIKQKGIYGFQAGVLGLIGKKALVVEIGVLPAVYAYKVAFVDVNTWIGLRLNMDVGEQVFVSMAYTPRLFTSYSNPDFNYYNAKFALKLGVNF